MPNSEVFVRRRAELASKLNGRVAILANQRASLRNIPLVSYPFRGSSHFVYFCGICPPGAMLVTGEYESVLFVDRYDPFDRIWHGDRADWFQLGQGTGVDRVLPREELFTYLEEIGRHRCLALPTLNADTNEELSGLLGRPLSILGADKTLAKAIIALRLAQDAFAIAEMRKACHASAKAHMVGLRNIEPNMAEIDLKVLIEAECARREMSMAYPSIVTVRGDVLHNTNYNGVMKDGDLVLVDAGAESAEGYASDITRTWPVSGKFSTTQAEVYAVVLAAQRRAMEAIKPGVNFRELHYLAAQAISDGLVHLGLLSGEVDFLTDKGVHALFFPHGLGHLVGLDVHDMEDLGDLAGYASGRVRSKQFGTSYLRLDRELRAGMVITIEPGIYFIDHLLNQTSPIRELHRYLQFDKLSMFTDIRGIRVEDTVLVTTEGYENLTADLPKEIAAIERAMAR